MENEPGMKWPKPNVMAALIAAGVALWFLLGVFLSLAFGESPSQCGERYLIRPQSTVTGLCGMVGGYTQYRGEIVPARACTIPPGPNAPALILLPSPETATWYDGRPMSPRLYAWVHEHELEHACGGLPAEASFRFQH